MRMCYVGVNVLGSTTNVFSTCKQHHMMYFKWYLSCKTTQQNTCYVMFNEADYFYVLMEVEAILRDQAFS